VIFGLLRSGMALKEQLLAALQVPTLAVDIGVVRANQRAMPAGGITEKTQPGLGNRGEVTTGSNPDCFAARRIGTPRRASAP
jgi:hypothetical protein